LRRQKKVSPRFHRRARVAAPRQTPKPLPEGTNERLGDIAAKVDGALPGVDRAPTPDPRDGTPTADAETGWDWRRRAEAYAAVPILRDSLKKLGAELDRLRREIEALWHDRQSIAALVDSEPRIARKYGLLAKSLEEVPRRDTIANVVAPEVTRSLAFTKGRPPGALGPLNSVLVEILEADPRMSTENVLAALRRRIGTGVIVNVRDDGMLRPAPGRLKRTRGPLVDWRHPATGEEKSTALSTISASLLTRARKKARANILAALTRAAKTH
jgi:hypothetical protein